MDLLSLALERHEASDEAGCDAALAAAETLLQSGRDSELLIVSTAAMCGRVGCAELLRVADVDIEGHRRLVGSVVANWRERGHSETVQLSKALLGYETRYTLLHLMAVVDSDECIDSELVSRTPVRALMRAVTKLSEEGNNRASAFLLSSIAQSVPSFGADAVEALIAADERDAALALAGDLFSVDMAQEHLSRLCESAVRILVENGKPSQAAAWVAAATGSSQLRAAAVLSPSRSSWLEALKASVDDPTSTSQELLTCFVGSVSVGVDISDIDTTIELLESRLSGRDTQVAASQLAESGMRSSAIKILSQCPAADAQISQAQLLDSVGQSEHAIAVLSASAKNRDHSVGELYRLADALNSRGVFPVATLVAVLRAPSASGDMQTLFDAAHMLAEIVIAGCHGASTAVGECLVLIAKDSLRSTSHPASARWLAASAIAGSSEAVDALSALRGDHHLGGWACLSLAVVASHADRRDESVQWLMHAVRWAQDNGDTSLRSASKDLALSFE